MFCLLSVILICYKWLFALRTSLQGSVLMDNSVIESSCDIKDCIVGSGHTVHSNCEFTLENLLILFIFLIHYQSLR